MNSRILAPVLIILGVSLAAGWCVIILPALFLAEAGAQLDLLEKLIIVAPLAAASAALVAGGRLGRAKAAAGPAGRAVATTALVVGILSGVVALGVLVA